MAGSGMALTSATGGSVWMLCERLRAEKLMVSSELDSVRYLHESIERQLHELGLLAWNTRLHQWTLNGLLSSRPDVQPESAFAILAALNGAQLVPAYRRLGHHHSAVASILNLLLGSPRSVAELLHAADQLPSTGDSPGPSSSTASVSNLPSSDEVTRSIFSLLYGHCVFPSDEAVVVEVLCSLVHLQLAAHADPRLVLRRGTACFARLYRLFTEGLYSVKVFLTEALHDSVMLVLCQDDAFLDIDPNKSVVRFVPAERARRFGTDPTSASYEKRLSAHRRAVIEKLVLITHSFVKGIENALHSLPPSLVWLIKQLHAALVQRKKVSAEQASLICTDLLVTNLLCTAIANPETIGVISDTPVSNVARFNLMQVGQLVQMLALSRHEPPPPSMQVFARQFEDSPLVGVVERVLSMRLPALEGAGDAGEQAGEREGAPLCPLSREDPVRRQHFIGSLQDVNHLVAVVQSAVSNQISDAGIRKELRSLSRRLPSTAFVSPSSVGRASTSPSSASGTPLARQSTGGGGGGGSSALRNIADKVNTVRSRPLSGGGLRGAASEDAECALPPEVVDVVVFTIGDGDEKVGLQPEEAFMETARVQRRKHKNSEGNEKRTRFLEEEQSNLGSAPSECTTEGGSDTGEEEEDDDRGSIGSSCDHHNEDRLLMLDEDGASTLPDNVSEMGAMSGRASPSLSGRDSPDGAESTIAAAGGASSTLPAGAAEVAARQAIMPRLPVTVRKQNAEGLEEKFGKFSLPPNHPYRDDQRSLLSDSWSTDVVPSDNEGPALMLPQPPQLGGGGHDQLLPGVGAGGQGPAGHHPRAARSGSLRNGSTAGGEDRSDTWSLDAIASDSEADRNDRGHDLVPIPILGVPSTHEQPAGPATSAASSTNGGAGGSGNLPLTASAANGGRQSDDGPRMRRQSSGSSFYSELGREEERRASLGIQGNLPVSKPASEEGEVTVEPEEELPKDGEASTSAAAPVPRVADGGKGEGDDDDEEDEEKGEKNGGGERRRQNGGPAGRRRDQPSRDGNGAANGGDAGGAGLSSPGYPGGVSFGADQEGSLKDKFSSEVRAKKAAFLQGLHRIGDKMKRGGSSGSMRISATTGDLATTAAEQPRAGNKIPESKSSTALIDLDATPDDILAKYKRPTGQQQQPVVLVDLSESLDALNQPPEGMAPPVPNNASASSPRPYYSAENVAACPAFHDAKRKLRFVLSGVGFLPTWYAAREKHSSSTSSEECTKDELVALLRVLLAEAVNGRERALCAQIRETIRCLGIFNAREVRKLIRSLKEDHRRRASYTLYLQQSRLSLLRLQAALERLTARVHREKSLTEECLVEMWITRFYLPNRHASLLEQYDMQFASSKAQDEKTDGVRRNLHSLLSQLQAASVFRPANDAHREYARKCVERSLTARIYHIAFYPNAEADVHRDEVLYRALARLGETISPAFLAIPESLLGECPWPSAQAEIAVVNAYKSPRDKLACVTRACETIANLLALMGETAAADDVTPILVYVLIMANPPALLSTVQYVEGFIGAQMEGADAYWWTQFKAAIEFIKTQL